MNPTTRLLLGIIALGMLIAGGLWLLFEPGAPAAGVLLRVGLILGAAWLVAPMIRRPGLAATLGIAAGFLVLMRPRLIWVVPLIAIVWRFTSRARA